MALSMRGSGLASCQATKLAHRPLLLHSIRTQTQRPQPPTSQTRAGAPFSTSAYLSTSSSSTSSAVPNSPSAPVLPWNEFLRLRRKRRFVNLAASIGSSATVAGVLVPTAISYEVENQIASITGLDPFIALGLTITAVGGMGWLIGPFVGNVGFGVWYSGVGREFKAREKEFYEHIKRFRADPTSSSVNNPVPDYYGEKIGSVADYRRWLKDQRAFNRKKSKNLI